MRFLISLPQPRSSLLVKSLIENHVSRIENPYLRAMAKSLLVVSDYRDSHNAVRPEGRWFTGLVKDFGYSVTVMTRREGASYIAELETMKGMNYLGTAIGRLPADLGLHFLFVGRGLQVPDFEADLADSYYAHQYTFAGFRTDVLNILAAANVSLLPSVKGEGLSKVLLESMFLARPTIMTDIGGNKGLGIDGETAIIVPARSDEALTEAMLRIAEDGALRAPLCVLCVLCVLRELRALCVYVSKAREARIRRLGAAHLFLTHRHKEHRGHKGRGRDWANW